MILYNVHPEVFLKENKDPFLSQHYADAHFDLSQVLPQAAEKTPLSSNQFAYYSTSGVDLSDEATRVHYEMTTVYKDQCMDKPIFCFDEGISEVLQNINCEIPIDYLPESHFSYMKFPEQYMFDGEDVIDGVYVFVGEGENILNFDEKFRRNKAFSMTYMTKSRSAVASTLFSLDKKGKVKNILSEYPTLRKDKGIEITDEDFLNHSEKIARLCLNAVLYVTHSDATCQIISPSPLPSPKKIKKLERDKKRKVLRNFTKMKIVLISDRVLESNIRYVDGTFKVSGHFRWQPHGVGRSLLKLIWINSHVRRHFRVLKKDPLDTMPFKSSESNSIKETFDLPIQD